MTPRFYSSKDHVVYGTNQKPWACHFHFIPKACKKYMVQLIGKKLKLKFTLI
jgi:hypothetical protein